MKPRRLSICPTHQLSHPPPAVNISSLLELHLEPRCHLRSFPLPHQRSTNPHQGTPGTRSLRTRSSTRCSTKPTGCKQHHSAKDTRTSAMVRPAAPSSTSHPSQPPRPRGTDMTTRRCPAQNSRSLRCTRRFSHRPSRVLTHPEQTASAVPAAIVLAAPRSLVQAC